MTPRRVLIAVVALLGVAVPALALAAKARDRTENPKFEVVEAHDGFEVRKYAPRIVAEVHVEGDPQEATSAGFRLLADFIFGNNTSASKVAMTAPVDRSERIAMTAPVDRVEREGQWTVAFTMPSEYSLDTLPRPNDDRVKIRRIPATRYAATRFSGNPKEPEVRRRMDALEAGVKAAGLAIADKPPTYARYDPPWTPGFMRRNEILLELAPEPQREPQPE